MLANYALALKTFSQKRHIESAHMLISHWPKQVTRPHGTGERVRRCSSTTHLEGDGGNIIVMHSDGYHRYLNVELEFIYPDTNLVKKLFLPYNGREHRYKTFCYELWICAEMEI